MYMYKHQGHIINYMEGHPMLYKNQSKSAG